MSDFPVEIICLVLTYVYTAEIEIGNETVGPLMKCADELGMCMIVEMCIDYLSNVTVDTAIMFYSIAENYDLCDIKECIYNFIIDNFTLVSRLIRATYTPAPRPTLLSLESAEHTVHFLILYCDSTTFLWTS